MPGKVDFVAVLPAVHQQVAVRVAGLGQVGRTVEVDITAGQVDHDAHAQQAVQPRQAQERAPAPAAAQPPIQQLGSELVGVQAHGQAAKKGRRLARRAFKIRRIPLKRGDGQLVVVLHGIHQKVGSEQQMVAETVEVLSKNNHDAEKKRVIG